MSSALQSFDHQLSSLLSEWSLVTTFLAIAIVSLLLYPLIYPAEPDTHPLLLARQSSASLVRGRGESAIYRSPEVPHGHPLKSGLNVKDTGAPRWSPGRDGDLRDVWREVQKGGSQGSDGKEIAKGAIFTVYGRDDVVEHEISELSKEIGIVGRSLKSRGVKKLAIYLPNSIEYLQTLFACSFYGLCPVLLPYDLPNAKLFELLNSTGCDGLVCQAGTVPLQDLASSVQSLNSLTWVVEAPSRHMDWSGSEGSRISVSVWHDVIAENKTAASSELPQNEDGENPVDVITVWQHKNVAATPEFVSFTQSNLVAAIGALISAIPLRQRIGPSDLVLPADSFSHNYVLCLTLAALFAHASIAINSVAVPGVDLERSRIGITPTVIIASAETMADLHRSETNAIKSGLQKLGKYAQDQRMIGGRMPTNDFFFKLLAPAFASTQSGKLRLILTSERLGAGSPPLTSTILSDLRLFTRSRIIYALTTAKVAGAVAQTNVFDYRQDLSQGHSHFGIPLSSLEIKLLNSHDDDAVAAQEPQGEILVTGYSVSGGSVQLPALAKVRADCTLAYA